MIDLDELRDRIGADDELIAELVQLFVEDAESLMTQISSAATQGDLDALASSAHGLKGAAANLSITHVRDHAKSVEMNAREGRLDAARDALRDLEAALVEFAKYATSRAWTQG